MIPNRVVLDTNVCLDLFVFRDPRWTMLVAALMDGSIHAVTRADCRREWQIVLEYPHLSLDNAAKASSAAQFDAAIRLLGDDEMMVQAETRLPICRDPDDQKFLELARDAKAAILITKDKALLKLARKTVKAGLFQIIPPEAWRLDESAMTAPA